MANKKNLLDSLFGPLEDIVGGMEKSRDFAGEGPPETKNGKYICNKCHESFNDDHDCEVVPIRKQNNKLTWGADKESSTQHLFEESFKSAVCGRTFDLNDVVNRRTELDDGNFKCCGGCLRILHSRYTNA